MVYQYLTSTTDINPGRLECGSVQWHGEDESLGIPLFRCSDDVW